MQSKNKPIQSDNALFAMVLGLLFSVIYFTACKETKIKSGSNLYEYDNNQETRWSSPENLNGEKGAGGKANNGANGHPFDSIGSGQTRVLLDKPSSNLPAIQEVGLRTKNLWERK